MDDCEKMRRMFREITGRESQSSYLACGPLLVHAHAEAIFGHRSGSAGLRHRGHLFARDDVEDREPKIDVRTS